jgi:hypothetical protein
MPELDLRLSVGSPTTTDGRDDGTVRLHVEDVASGVVLLDVEMPVGRWWRLNQGQVMRRKGFVSPHLEHVGERERNKQTVVPREVTDGVYDRDKARALAMEWAEKHGDPLCRKEVRPTNSGWVVIERWWEPTQEGAEA